MTSEPAIANKTRTWDGLPDELAHLITDRLGPADLLALTFVSRKWRQASRLQKKRPPSAPLDVLNTAAREGRLKYVRWAHEQGSPLNTLTCKAAAEGGHLEVLKWLHEQGCPWDELTCKAAAEGGHLDVLKWLHEQDCPLNTLTCKAAAEGGHLDTQNTECCICCNTKRL
eukprot:jgi/Tetstr1/448446/TSEL_035714.t1